MERNNFGRQRTLQETTGPFLAGSTFLSFLSLKTGSCLGAIRTGPELHRDLDEGRDPVKHNLGLLLPDLGELDSRAREPSTGNRYIKLQSNKTPGSSFISYLQDRSENSRHKKSEESTKLAKLGIVLSPGTSCWLGPQETQVTHIRILNVSPEHTSLGHHFHCILRITFPLGGCQQKARRAERA